MKSRSVSGPAEPFNKKFLPERIEVFFRGCAKSGRPFRMPELKHCRRVILRERFLKGQCPDYAHARTSSVFSSKDNRTVKLTRQDFLPDNTADRDLLFIFSSNILDFRRSLI